MGSGAEPGLSSTTYGGRLGWLWGFPGRKGKSEAKKRCLANMKVK